MLLPSNRASTVSPALMLACGLASLLAVADARASMAIIQQFSSGIGTPVGCAYDGTADSVWVYGAFDATITQFSSTGAVINTIPRPGESANDTDMEVASVALTLGTTPLPAGTLLFINGESGTADIYAINKTTGAILATLTTAFGNSHVVGGAYHPTRGTFFLVQDKVAGASVANRVAEVNAQTGAVINVFSVAGAFSVNYGDIEVATGSGNILLVSSDESRVAEFTPAGVFVSNVSFPAGVASVTGIAVGGGCSEAWLTGSGGTVWRVSGAFDPDLPADLNGDHVVDGGDLGILLAGWGGAGAADLNGDGTVDGADLGVLLGAWGSCPS